LNTHILRPPRPEPYDGTFDFAESFQQNLERGVQTLRISAPFSGSRRSPPRA